MTLTDSKIHFVTSHHAVIECRVADTTLQAMLDKASSKQLQIPQQQH